MAVVPTLRSAPLVALVALAAGACATGGGRTKGGLHPVAGLSPAQVSEAARPRKVALLVGVNGFADPFWPALRWAGKDAERLGAVLGEVGGFDQVTVLAGPQAPDRASVLRAVSGLAALAPRPEDTVLVYFSSHGTLAPVPGGLERVLVLKDTRQHDLFGTGLPITELMEAFEGLPSRRKALVLATCHSGTGKSLYTPQVQGLLAGLKGGVPSLESVSRASLVLSAADFGQPAREDDGLEHDVYTYFLLEALTEGADANGDGAVSVTEAHDHARRRTFEHSGGRQVPTVESAMVGADPVILAGRVARPGLPVLFSYAAGLAGYEVRVSGRTKGSLPGNVVLEAGPQDLVVLRGERELYRGRVRLRPGERLPLERLLDRARPRASAGLRWRAFGLLDPSLGAFLPLGGPAAALRLRDAPIAGFDAVFELGGAAARQTVLTQGHEVPQEVTVLHLGVGGAFARELGALRLYGGPHLVLISLARSLRLPGLEEAQRLVTITPGALVGGAYGLGRFELQLEVQAHYLPLIHDGVVKSVGTAALSGGVGWRF